MTRSVSPTGYRPQGVFANRVSLLAATLALVALVGALGAPAPASALPPIRHLFIIVVENENADTSFGPSSSAPYLARTLTAQGAFLPNYYATGHLSLANYIAMVGGQGPNPYTQADAPAYVDLLPGTAGPDGQSMGSGSVYPSSVQTIAGQLEAKGLSWRAYMEDMANSTTQPKTCRHPALGTPDDTQSARPGDQYAARHNPFVYFHSIIDNQAGCDTHDVSLGLLPADLRSASTTPNYVFITPNLCHDGHDAPCVDGQPGGLVSADRFLAQWVPQITASPAFADGALLVLFDEATSDATSCCAEKSSNTPNAGGTTMGSGGGRVGAVVISPYTIPGTRTATKYNHYSMLRTVEDLFGLSHLGYAAAEGLAPFGADVFNGPAPSTGPRATVGTGGARGCAGVAVPRRGRLPKGTLISRLRLRGRGTRRTLLISVRRRTRLTVVLHPRGGRAHRIRGRTLAGCKTYRVRLRVRKGTRIVVSAAVGRAAEHRALRR